MHLRTVLLPEPLDYFNADFVKTLRPVFILNTIMIAAAYASIL